MTTFSRLAGRLTNRNLLIGTVLLSVLVSAVLYRRFAEIRNSREVTAEFCNTLKAGDSLFDALENAQPGSSQLAAAVGVYTPTPPKTHARERSKNTSRFSVIVEDRKGMPGWPRFLIWTGPAYNRWYCSLEATSDGRIKALHLGPIDTSGENSGFIESMLQDWLG